eukprot:c13306_g1_i2.p3 GENE.c13306_g1_i2~~c13306_g1_i2.p3  ORF type:complete len:100 (+),score=9.57 c13306_g1_i2:431-730(+)
MKLDWRTLVQKHVKPSNTTVPALRILKAVILRCADDSTQHEALAYLQELIDSKSITVHSPAIDDQTTRPAKRLQTVETPNTTKRRRTRASAAAADSFYS